MKDISVPVIVCTKRREDAELVNKTLRDAGHTVRCKVVSRMEDLESTLEATPPHLLLFFPDAHSASIREVAKLRQLYASMSPLIIVSDTADDATITAALQAGAHDLVSTAYPARLLAVCERELRTFRLERALNETFNAAQNYKRQLKSFLSASADAFAQVQEGIIVEANQAWADLFAEADVDSALGPVMDFVAPGSQAALKGALLACGKNKWDGRPLRLEAALASGKSAPVELMLERSSHDGDPAVRLSILRQAEAGTEQGPESIVEQVLRTDPVTGFYLRQQFIELLTDKLDHRNQGGARALVFVRPDRFGEIEGAVGPMASEEIIGQIAETLGHLMSDADIAGRFGGTIFALVLERGSLRDIEAWAENALTRIGEHVFEVADRSFSLTCTFGLAELGEGTDRVENLIRNADQALQRGRKEGGNRAVVEETTDASTRVKRVDALWTRQIKSALVDSRFKLMHLNIASLSGKAVRMYDSYLRMIDEQGDEVAATDFMGTAERNNLLRPIDRWVVDASIGYCRVHACDLLLVKLSHESILDPSLQAWVGEQLKRDSVKPASLCFQVSEDDASHYLKQTQATAEALRRLGCRFAIERFGIGRDPLKIMANIPVDFVKFDGSLMQGLANNAAIQEKLRGFVSGAKRNGIETIAARVENANTMAVLFQLGVDYMQGHYLQEPAEVILEAVG